MFHIEDLHFWLTSVAMTHSLLSSAITNTDWYMESLEEHIVDILHSGFSLQTQIMDSVRANEKHMAASGMHMSSSPCVAEHLSNVYIKPFNSIYTE